MNWQINIQPTPKSKETDRARIFLDMTRVQTPEPVIDEIDAYIAALQGFGDAIPEFQETALRTYRSTLQTAGVWEKLELLMPFLGVTARGQSTALRTPASVQPEMRGFVDTDATGFSLSNIADDSRHINTKVLLTDLASQTEITLSVGVESTIGGPFAGIFNDDATGDDSFFQLGYAPFDGLFFFADTTYFDYFGDPALLPAGDFIADTSTPGDGSWSGLFTGLKPTDDSRIQLYYAKNTLSLVTPSNPAITAPVGLSPTPTTPPELHVFGFSGAPNSDNHNNTTDLDINWVVLGSNWTDQNRIDYLNATETLFFALGKTFETFGGGGGD